MKVLMFAPIFPPVIGGPATQCFSLCKALVARGVGVVVLTPGERFERKSPDGYPVYRYPWKYTHTALDKPIRWIVFSLVYLTVLVRERPNILHAHSVSAPTFIAGAFARLFGIPSIVKFAGDWVWETLSTGRIRGKDFDDIYASSIEGRFLTWVEKAGVSLYNLVWTPSLFRRDNVVALLGNDSKVRIIPNCLILPPSHVRELTQEDEQIVISANRFIPHKRVSSIVEAFANARTPHSRLILIGGGEEKEERAVRDTIERLELTQVVTCTGILQSAEIYELFKKASFYVSASLEEGFPNVFIEAMHYGLPIVATNVGGCKEMVIEGKTGYLVDPMDMDELSSKMHTLLTDLSQRNEFAKRAHTESEKYDLTVVVDEFIALYNSMLSKKI
jgi:glycosyltransferase involved in cell wall biosynthesis